MHTAAMHTYPRAMHIVPTRHAHSCHAHTHAPCTLYPRAMHADAMHTCPRAMHTDAMPTLFYLCTSSCVIFGSVAVESDGKAETADTFVCVFINPYMCSLLFLFEDHGMHKFRAGSWQVTA
jgi:hypothetical protein